MYKANYNSIKRQHIMIRTKELHEYESEINPDILEEYQKILYERSMEQFEKKQLQKQKTINDRKTKQRV